MNRINSVITGVAVLLITGPVLAAGLATEAEDEILQRQQKLSSMEFKRDQLKLQAEMSLAIKQMSDSGLLVDEEGNPVGVDSFTTLATEVRGRSAVAHLPTANPFEIPGALPQQRPPMPGVPPSYQQRAGQPDADSFQGRMRLVQIGNSSIVVRTETGDRVLRVGEKLNGLSLEKFDASRAYFKGDNGVEVLSIEWPQGRI